MSALPITPPAETMAAHRCSECACLHAGLWTRCPLCESNFQREQRYYSGDSR